MARKLKDKSPARGKTATASAEHNVAARRDLIVAAKQQIDQIDKQILPKMEEVKALRKQKGNIFRNLKNDLDMDRDDAELAFRMVDLDPENRSKFADTIREIFSACGVGEQTNFLDALERDDAGGSNRPAPGTIAEDGYEAGLAGKNASLNPYKPGSDAHSIWADNWTKGQGDAVRANFASNGSAPAEVTAH